MSIPSVEYSKKPPVFALDKDFQTVELTGNYWRCPTCGIWKRTGIVCDCTNHYANKGVNGMPFEQDVERWDRTATANPESFAGALKKHWTKRMAVEVKQNELEEFQQQYAKGFEAGSLSSITAEMIVKAMNCDKELRRKVLALLAERG